MARKNYQKQEEMFPKGGAKPPGKKAVKAEPEQEAGDPGLNSAIDAAEGGQSDPAVDLEAPKIQPAGNFPTAEDAYADMSQPAPAAPVEHLELNHGPTVPRDAFCVIPQNRYISLWMFNLPYGTAMPGEEFVQPVDKKLLDQFRKECPQLTLKRFEIRLLQRADGSHYFLEVHADPEKTPKAEATRGSLLRLLTIAETQWVIAEKIAGIWGKGDSTCTTSSSQPHQSYKELVDRTYGDKIHRDMSRAVLQRFRKIV